MDPFTMATLLLGDLELTSGQLAQLRAINTKYFTELAARERTAGGGDRDMVELHAMIASDIRDMLTEEQQVVYDRNVRRHGVARDDEALHRRDDLPPNKERRSR